MIDNYNECHDHADDRIWSDQDLVDGHNEIVNVLEQEELMPRLEAKLLGALALFRFEIEHRIGDIADGREVEYYITEDEAVEPLHELTDT